MKIVFVVDYLCLLSHVVVQQTMGQTKEPILFHKPNHISKNVVNLSERNNDNYQRQIFILNSKHRQSRVFSHSKKKVAPKHFSILKQNKLENGEERKHGASKEEHLPDLNNQSENGIANVASENVNNQLENGIANVASENVNNQLENGIANVASENVNNQLENGIANVACENVNNLVNVASENVNNLSENGIANVASENVNNQLENGIANVASENMNNQLKNGIANVASENVNNQLQNGIANVASENVNNLSENGIANVASETVNRNLTTNNNEDFDKPKKQSFKVEAVNVGLHLMREKRDTNQGETVGNQSTEGNKGVYSTSSPSESDLSDTVQLLVLEMKKLHKQHKLDRERYQSLQQQFRSIKNANGKQEETNKQLRDIRLQLRSVDAETKITRKEISAIKYNQQHFLTRLGGVSARNDKLANKIHKMSAICQERLLSLTQSNDLDSKVINSAINVRDGGSRAIKEEIRKMTENKQAAHLMINLQANVSTVLERKINKTLWDLRCILRDVSLMQDLINCGHRAGAAQVSASSNRQEKKMSSKKNSEFSDLSDEEEICGGQRCGGSKVRKTRHLPSLALIIHRSEINMEDSSKQNQEETLSQDNQVQYKPVQASGVLGAGFRAHGNRKVNIVDDVRKETSLFYFSAGPLEERGAILLQEAEPILPSSSCIHLDDQLQASTTVAELQSVKHRLSAETTSTDSRLPSLSSSSMEVQAPPAHTDRSQMAPMSILFGTESSPSSHVTSEHFLLSNSAAPFQRIMLNKVRESLATSSQPLSISSTEKLSPTLSETSFILQSLNFDLSQSKIKDDQGVKENGLVSSSHWLQLFREESEVALASSVATQQEGTRSDNWVNTEDGYSSSLQPSEVTSPYISTSEIPSNSLQPVLGQDSFSDHAVYSAIHVPRMSSSNNLQSPGNSISPSPKSHNTPSLPVIQTLSGWSDATSSPCIPSSTSHLSPTGSRMYTSYSSQPQPLTYFDQMFVSSLASSEDFTSLRTFASLESIASLQPFAPLEYFASTSVNLTTDTITLLLGLSDMTQSSLPDAMSAAGGEEMPHIIRALANPHTTQPVDFLNLHTTQSVDFPNLHTTQPVDFPNLHTTQPVDFLNLHTTQSVDFLNLHTKQCKDTTALDQTYLSSGTSTLDQTYLSPGTSTLDQTYLSSGTSTLDQTYLSPGTSTLDQIYLSSGTSTLDQTYHSTGTSTLDQTYLSPGTSDTIKVYTTPVMYWPVELSSLPEKSRDKMLIATEDSAKIKNSPQDGQLLQFEVNINLELSDSHSRIRKPINVITGSSVIDVPATGAYFPGGSLADLLSTTADTGQNTQASPSTRSDHNVHRGEMNSSLATSTTSRNPIILSVSDTGPSPSIDTLRDMSTSEEAGTYLYSSQSDFWSIQWKPDSSRGKIQTLLATGTINEAYTTTPVTDWASPPLGHLRDGLSSRADEGEKVNSLSLSQFLQFESFTNTQRISFQSVTAQTSSLDSVTHLTAQTSSFDSVTHLTAQTSSLDSVTHLTPQTSSLDSVTHLTPQTSSLDSVTHLTAQTSSLDSVTHLTAQTSSLDSVTHLTPQTSSLDSVTAQTSSLDSVTHLTPQTSSLDSVTPQTSSLDSVTAQTSSLDSVTAQTSSLDSVTPQTSSLDSVTAQTSSLDSVTAQTSSLDSVTAQTSSLDSVTPQTSSLDSVTAQTSSLDSVTAQTSSLDSVTHLTPQTSSLDSVTAQTSSLDSVTAQTSSLDSVTAQTSSLDSVTPQTSSLDSVTAQTSSLDSVTAQTSSLDSVTAQTSSLDSVTPQTSSLDSVIAQTSSLDSVTAQTSSLDSVTHLTPQTSSLDSVTAQTSSLDSVTAQTSSLDSVTHLTPQTSSLDSVTAQTSSLDSVTHLTPQTSSLDSVTAQTSSLDSVTAQTSSLDSVTHLTPQTSSLDSVTAQTSSLDSVTAQTSSLDSVTPQTSSLDSVTPQTSSLDSVTHLTAQMSSVDSVTHLTAQMSSVDSVTHLTAQMSSVDSVTHLTAQMSSVDSVTHLTAQMSSVDSVTHFTAQMSSVDSVTHLTAQMSSVDSVTHLTAQMSSVDSVTHLPPQMSSVDSVTAVTPQIWRVDSVPRVIAVKSSVASGTAWTEFQSPYSKEYLQDIMPTTVTEVNHSVPQRTDSNDTNTGEVNPRKSDIHIPQSPATLPPRKSLNNISMTSGSEIIQVFNVNQTDQLSESNSSQKQTSDKEYTANIEHIEERLSVVEKSMIQLTSARMLPSQNVNSLLLNAGTDVQAELEAYFQNRTSDLMQQLGRDMLLVQSQHNELKQEFAKQQVYVQSKTADLMKELKRQRSKSNDLKEEMEKQKTYSNMQVEEMKHELEKQRVKYEILALEVAETLSQQNMFLQNQTQWLQEQLQTQAANVEHTQQVVARTSMIGTYLMRKVSAINMTEFISRLEESLHKFTTNVLTQEQWSIDRQRIVNASLDNQAKILQIQTTLMDTAHSVTKLQGRVRNVYLMGERWYKSLQGHMIRLNNTVQDLRENAIHANDFTDQTTDYSPGVHVGLQSRVDSLHVQLLYNSNRLSSLEASMLNLSLTECRRSSEEVSQVSKIRTLNERQEEMKKALSTIKEKVNALHLNALKVHSSVKTVEKAAGSVRDSVTSLLFVAPEIHDLRKQMDNVLFLVPQDCHEYFHRGYSESGVYVIYPRRFNRTVRVFCVMEDGHNSNCHSCSPSNKENSPRTVTSINSGFSRSRDKNNDSLSEAADKNNIDNDNTDMKCCRGWTVIQRREAGRLNFTRPWEEYADGFGTAGDEHWAGNDMIHALTTQGDYELRFVMEDISSTIWQATYSQFKLAGKQHAYRIHLSGYYGNVTDGMISSNTSAFSTADFDNDASSSHCALFNGGGWWYNQCHVTNLNGPYNIGMIWFSSVKQDWIQMKSSMMMIRPKA